jgi:hypothetical protein
MKEKKDDDCVKSKEVEINEKKMKEEKVIDLNIYEIYKE